MADDWSDPDEAERELRRREGGEAPGEASQAQARLSADTALAVRDALERLETDSMRLNSLLARFESARPDAPPTSPETATGKQLAQTEGRLAAEVGHLMEHVRPVGDALPDIQALARTAAALPTALKHLKAAVDALTRAIGERTVHMDRLTVELKDMVRGAELKLIHRFDSAANGVRDTLEETAAVVRKRHRRSRWFRAGLAGVALALLGAGVWLQWNYEPVPPQDATSGWRDYIWDKFGDTIYNCIIEMRRTGSEIDCRLSPPEPAS